MADNGRPHGEDAPEVEGAPQPGGEEQQGEAAQRGRMRQQDPETTTPREPTLSEKRARIAAEQRRAEQERAELAAQQRKTDARRRVMIGGGVTVGVVALVSAFYSGAAYSQEQNAVQQYCAGVQQGSNDATVQDARYCDEEWVSQNGGHVSGGMFFMPIFLPGGQIGGYHSYRYGYTQPGTAAPPVGGTVTSPNYTKPAGTTIKDTSGKTVQRGGFGISSNSGGFGGKSGTTGGS